MNTVDDFLKIATLAERELLQDLFGHHKAKELISSRTLRDLLSKHNCDWSSTVSLLTGHGIIEEIEETLPSGLKRNLQVLGLLFISTPEGPYFRITHRIVEFIRHAQRNQKTKAGQSPSEKKEIRSKRIRELKKEKKIVSEWARLRDIANEDALIKSLDLDPLTNETVRKICQPKSGKTGRKTKCKIPRQP